MERGIQRRRPEVGLLWQGFITEEVRAEVLRCLAPRPDALAADVGSGTRLLAAGLEPLVAQVHCVGASDGMPDRARGNLKDFGNVRHHQANGESTPLPDESVAAVTKLTLR